MGAAVSPGVDGRGASMRLIAYSTKGKMPVLPMSQSAATQCGSAVGDVSVHLCIFLLACLGS